MRPLDDPSARFVFGIDLLGLNFFTPLAHMRCVITFFHSFLSRLSGIALIRTQVLLLFLFHLRSINYDLIQRRLQQFHVVFLGPAHDYRQRDSILVYEQAAFCSIFFPDPWGWARPLPAPMAL